MMTYPGLRVLDPEGGAKVPKIGKTQDVSMHDSYVSRSEHAARFHSLAPARQAARPPLLLQPLWFLFCTSCPSMQAPLHAIKDVSDVAKNDMRFESLAQIRVSLGEKPPEINKKSTKTGKKISDTSTRMCYYPVRTLTQSATRSLTITSLNHPRVVSSEDSRQNVVPVFHGPGQQRAPVAFQDTTIRDILQRSEGEACNSVPTDDRIHPSRCGSLAVPYSWLCYISKIITIIYPPPPRKFSTSASTSDKTQSPVCSIGLFPSRSRLPLSSPSSHRLSIRAAAICDGVHASPRA